MYTRILDFQSFSLLSNSTLGSFLPLKVFGCICYIHVPKLDRSKLDPKALKCIFLGFALNHKGCRCNYPSTRKCIVPWTSHFMRPFFFFYFLLNNIFHKIVSFFSPSHPYLQEEKRDACKDEIVLPLFALLSFLDIDGCHRKGELEVVQNESEPT